MLSKIPLSTENMTKEDIDREIMRMGMIAELDAINLYEQLAVAAESDILKKVLMDIAREEKAHIGEFQAMLLKADPEQAKELKEGKEEVTKLEKDARDNP
ncbi:MAG TPA: ferritin family protein [Candidatus Nanoarchaeia archaeon]|nr:ferritin family protein [Candidatus Nanoarchaeia archaeon]